MLREHLEAYFSASLRDCYQTVKVLPPLDEVQLEQEKTTLVIVRPGGQANQLPISTDWQAWWEQQQYKNRVLFLTGQRDTFQKVLDSARQTRALQSIEEELRAENTPAEDPQWRALDALRDRVGLQFTAALKEAFDQIVYPSINAALQNTNTDLAFANNQNSEATIRKTLESAQKFTTKIDDDSFLTRAEARLFGSPETKVVLWADFKRAAAVNTNWPLHKISALDDLKASCVRRDLWREEGNHVRRGPFPPPAPEVSIRELSVQEEREGYTYLKLEPLHAPAIVYETGDALPTSAATPVPTPARFEASGLRYRFLAHDPQDPSRVSPVKDWSPRLRIKHQLHPRGSHHELELLALPKANGIAIRYTTDGSSPTNAGYATYDGIVRVPANCRVVCALAISEAFDLVSEVIKIAIPQQGQEDRSLDPAKPAGWNQQTKLDDAGSVWDFIQRLDKTVGIVAYDINLTAESSDGHQILEYTGALQDGYGAAALNAVAEKLQDIVSAGSLRMTVGSLAFSSGQVLLDWLKATNQPFNAAKVVQ
ncbi:MAG: chitobiase/beta-hexosaminidase C-terminal domain-containing protein [Proteobacteria bacterium]|nr:chitobiase/beta-hexosaminidase C-terminal domain-containing protein [Pseudomonadota bacterium]